MAKPLSRATSWLLVIGTLASLAASQSLFDSSSKNFEDAKKLAARNFSQPLIPSVAFLKAFSLGDTSLAADLIWLDTIQYFGGNDPYGTSKALPQLLDTVTQLDPKFEYPYELALTVLPFQKAAPQAASIGERGLANIPNNGILTYYLATVYHLNLKDYKRAAYLYKLASSQPGAPSAASTLAGTALDHIAGTPADRLVAAEFWKTVYETSKNTSTQDLAKNWYQQMLIIYQLETAAVSYKTQHGQFPASLNDLVTDHLVGETSASPVKRLYDYDNTTGKINFDRIQAQLPPSIKLPNERLNKPSILELAEILDYFLEPS